MSPHRLSDFVDSDSGSSTPVLVDALSDVGQSSPSVGESLEDFRAGSQANEPIAIVGIGQHHRLLFFYDLLTF